MDAPTVLRITRLVSRAGRGPMLVERCAAIATRERVLHPNAFVVFQGRRLLPGDRIELVSITQWRDLELVRGNLPAAAPPAPPFYQEYADALESWQVELFEATWTPDAGAVDQEAVEPVVT